MVPNEQDPVFQIEPLDSSAPEVVQLQSLWKAEVLSDGRYGIYLSYRELRAQDGNTKDEDLTFHIHRPPYFGYLENTIKGEALYAGASGPISSVLSFYPLKIQKILFILRIINPNAFN